MRGLADMLIDHAAQVLAPLRPVQARAMRAELAYAKSGALAFALGCVLAAYRQRLSPILAATFSVRLATALAATAFALVHIEMPATNLCLKATLTANDSFWRGCVGDGFVSHAQLGYLHQYSLGHWLWVLMVLGAMGVLHLVAVAQLLQGRPRRMASTAVAIAVLAAAMPLLGAGGLTLPPIYMAMIAAMVGMGLLLARIERFDIVRRTRPEA